MASKELTKLKTALFDNVRLRLGSQIIDVELDNEHLEVGLENAINRYRQLSSNAVEESYGFLKLEKNRQDYFLDSNVLEVRQIFRRTIGSTTGGGASNFEPFEAGYMNMYMLKAGSVGGLATYEMFSGYQETAARMFGGFINYVFDAVTKKLTIVRKIDSDEGEDVLMWMYNQKPDENLIQHHMTKKWMEDFTLAMCKQILGESRSKFATIAGPQGGTTMNGSELKAEGQQEMADLVLQLHNYEDGGIPMSFIIG